MKCCKIISTHFNQRLVRDRETKSNYIKWPSHIQFGYGPPGVLTMLKDQVSIEMDVDAGVECDTLIINSDAGFKEGNEYIENIDGIKTRRGHIHSMTMNNIGGQFGAYNLAYTIWRDHYDYWMLDEDDIIITGHHYYKNLIDRLGENESCYALIGLVEHPHHPITAGGALLLMRDYVLGNVKSKCGILPHPHKNDHISRVQEGEIAWTQNLFELGYKIVYKGKSKQGVTVEWDYKTDYCLPYREMVDRFFTVENFKKSDFYRGAE